ncbi:MAG TPA: cobyric acid synthase [Candidatus Acidoferrum sp.]|nr:cobyric acid synthase [Candidatus Acidoferrum sp.]
MSRAKSLMVLGTASNVGKSLTVGALCRIFADDGYDVAPFKAQNMSLNAAVTPDGREIGRAQAMQAEAARRPAEVAMNPILLKPSGDRRSQVVLEGAIWDEVDAWEYHRRRTAELFPRVLAAYDDLAARCELIVLEGAGSPAEINLKAGDIVNLRMAEAAGAPCLLVADIDRGGSFAALAGTLALLEPHERERVRAFAITKFRGDRALLDPGIVAIERRLGIPCAGVVPWIDALGIDEEDGYAPAPSPRAWPDGENCDRPLRVAVIALPFFANATDVDALAAEPSVVVRRVDEPAGLERADVIVLPGSKETVRDLKALRDAVGLSAPYELRAWRAQRESRYDRLAAIVRESLDIGMLRRIAGLPSRS